MKKTFKKSFAVLTALLMLCCMLPVGVFAEGDIPIDEEHFPDANFRNFVLTGSDDETGVKIDTDSSGALSPEEIAGVTYINVGDMEIADLTGIEYFTALTKLWCGDNQLTQLDVSNNTALEMLLCWSNQLTQLDVSNNTALWHLDCSDNQLTQLDVSNNTALYWLDYGYNPLINPYQPLETLSEELITNLRGLGCGGLGLTELDVNPYTALESLYCYDNQLTELDVSKNTALKWLYCNNNQLTELDVSKNTALNDLRCNDNQLTQLDVSNNAWLLALDCSDNQLTNLDVSNNTYLEDWDEDYEDGFNCDNNKYRVSSDPFDLTTLPGNFDVTKASNWQGATVNGTILTFTADFATYTYDCGNGLSAEFMLILSDTVPGDYDCSGVVNVQDAILTLRAAMNLITPSEQSLLNADMDNNGQLTVTDAITILRKAMGLV